MLSTGITWCCVCQTNCNTVSTVHRHSFRNKYSTDCIGHLQYIQYSTYCIFKETYSRDFSSSTLTWILPMFSSGLSFRLSSYLSCEMSCHVLLSGLHGNLLICTSLIRSFAHFAQIKWATVSDLLRSLITNERPRANRSGRSEEMGDRERIAQVSQDKQATMSDSLLGAQRKWANERLDQKSLAKQI